ncbi:MAG: 4Fe-4S dicluster domain-containing protein [Methanobacteriaceae archaeon]|nr:4Fe-4S dicluster domain-containing protein [Methanobacteriaceae archaeon]MDP3035811.1 4Fe-4S dicluster domain-containing protein [Methanobacteriaceae archaeon]MDP3624129.1 4Fe-4S dicluster domain-containing protein [Methanobacteriaceae archaeon]
MLKKGMDRRSQNMVEEIKSDYKASADLGLKRCMQCGLCTSNCPAAKHSNYDPREMVKMVLDDDQEIKENPDIWNCFYCYTCQSNCPVNNSACQVNQILRETILLEGGNNERIVEFLSYGYSYMDFGVGAIPSDFFDALVKDFGDHYIQLKINLEDIREELGLVDYNLKGESLDEIRNILIESGFKKRLETFQKQGES